MCSASPFLHSAMIPARSISARLRPPTGHPPPPSLGCHCRSAGAVASTNNYVVPLDAAPSGSALSSRSSATSTDASRPKPSCIMVWSKNQNNDPSTSRGSKPKNNMIIMYTAKFHDIEDSSWLSLELNRYLLSCRTKEVCLFHDK
ncbi:hypothetical protein EJB05_34571, partial [Eragrostis curvula]